MLRNSPAWLTNWLERHQSSASFWLHMLGIPLTIAALVLGAVQLAHWRWDLWWRPAVLLTAGYVLQFIGHALEGNDAGELILIKRLIGRPYVAVSPRYGPLRPRKSCPAGGVEPARRMDAPEALP